MEAVDLGNVKRHRLHDQVVKHLAVRILEGVDARSEPVTTTEAELCRDLNVSRTILRQAVKVLEAKGLVDVRPRVGVRIRPRREWNVADPDLLAWQSEMQPDAHFLKSLCEVRRILEPAAAELAALRADNVQIAEIHAWYREMERYVEDPEPFIAADMEFHKAIFSAARNELLARISSTIGTALRTSRTITTRRPGSSIQALEWHRAVADAIRDHDAPGARAAMDWLIQQTTRDIEDVMRAQGT